MNDNKNEVLSFSFKALARERGAVVHELDIKELNPSYSVRLKCQVPLCEYYGVCKVCPPHIPGVAEFREAIADYSLAYLIVLREKIYDIDKYRKDFKAELQLAEIVSALEVKAFQLGYCKAMGLCVGGCKLCPKCTPPDEPCRHPFKARPSPEGFGIDITELARNAGVPVEWPPKEYVSFLGLILV